MAKRDKNIPIHSGLLPRRREEPEPLGGGFSKFFPAVINSGQANTAYELILMVLKTMCGATCCLIVDRNNNILYSSSELHDHDSRRQLLHTILTHENSMRFANLREHNEFNQAESTQIIPVLPVMVFPLRDREYEFAGMLYLDRHAPDEGPFDDILYGSVQSLVDALGPILIDDTNQSKSQEIIGQSPAILNLKKTIENYAKYDLPVIIYGETGTGKELIANSIVKGSRRNKRPYVTVDCGNIGEVSILDELFGHVKGAFTGALDNKIGYMDKAQGGTLFFDEIGNLSKDSQKKLMRAIENKEFFRVGGVKAIPYDARLIFATNADLEAAIVKETFRNDFYYRINVLRIDVPPLRQRKEDIPLLANHFYETDMNTFSLPWSEPHFTEDAMKALGEQEWRGNIRELKLVVTRTIVTRDSNADSNVYKRPISREELKFTRSPAITPSLPLSDNRTLKQIRDFSEAAALREALEKSNGIQNAAADLLHVKYSTMSRLRKKHNL